MKRALAALLLVTATFGCEDDEPANRQPEVFRGDVVCRSLGVATFVLDSIEVLVYDADGASDLERAVGVVEATSLELSFEALGAEAAAQAAEGRRCEGECVGRYRWERSPSSEQIFCGTDGTLLEVDFEVFDRGGLSSRAFIRSRAR